MRNLHVWVIGLFVVVAVALASPFTQMSSAPSLSQHLTGTYLSESDDEMSWIKLVELGNGKVRCTWHKLKLMNDGKVTQQGFTFEGKIKGNRISMQAFLFKPKRLVVSAEALHENGTIRMSLSMEFMTFHNARYKPSGIVEVARTQERFIEQGQDLIMARKEAIIANIPKEELAQREQMQKDSEVVRQGNQYIMMVRDFRKDYPKTIKEFEKNTASMVRYLEQVLGAQKLRQRSYVTQSYMQMQEVLDNTYILQNDQDAFREIIAREIKPYINQMKQKQKSCAGQTLGMEDQLMCKSAQALEKSLNTQITGIEKIFEDIRAAYRKNVAAQRKMLEDARHVVNPDAVE